MFNMNTLIKRGLIGVVVVSGASIGLAGRADAESVTQSVGFHFAPHGTNFGSYDQFHPSSGVLSGVGIGVSGMVISFASFFNNTSTPITFTGFIANTLHTDAGDREIMSSFRETLPPHRGVLEGGGGSFDVSTLYEDHLSFWIGTGRLGPFLFAARGGPLLSPTRAGADDPGILVDTAIPAEAGPIINGVETVTYYFVVPEPPSAVMSGTAALVLTGIGQALRARVK